MNINEYNNPKNSLVLFELSKKFDFLIRAYNSEKFPKVLMLSGEKGIGKFTLINHFLSYVYDKNNYDLESHTINNQTLFYKQYLKDLFPNIMYLSGNNFKSSKIGFKLKNFRFTKKFCKNYVNLPTLVSLNKDFKNNIKLMLVS